MEGNVAAAYTLIYHFLKQQSQNKAAEAVKKAAKPFVVLRDDIEQKGPSLGDIIKEWKTMRDTKSENTDSSSEESDSSNNPSSGSQDSSSSASDSEESEDTSGSDSDGEDTCDDLDEGIPESSPQKPAERDTSATLSSAGETVLQTANRAAPSSKRSIDGVDKGRKTSTESDSSDSDSSDSDSSSTSDGSDAESSSGGSDSSSSSHSSKKKAHEQPLPSRTKTTVAKSQSTSESSSESEDEFDAKPQQEQDIHVAKKRKVSEDKGAVVTAVTDGSQVRKKEPYSKVGQRFQRVKVQNLAPELLLDNGYKARSGVANDYGERAHRDLVATRGAGFRKEKNKKKRGSYRGGEITMENHSIKFDF